MHPIVPSDSRWFVDEGIVTIVLSKAPEFRKSWWDGVFDGLPTIDVSKVPPEAAGLSDLADGTREMVERMMYDQGQKARGLPTSEEQQKAAILQRFMSQHPELDFSGATLM
eukprot:gnl/Ergobibamus_cyprinoides/1447.p1 GENE.gnl/Ergobibamus_cyprinoides/1447~~gnl/Ergobibamus_cyprinoides/1447.p1  ORF type:complete len:111 (+),score=23.01 gnl/Ergobibamus_cyprinoides/1447:162-494(+)